MAALQWGSRIEFLHPECERWSIIESRIPIESYIIFTPLSGAETLEECVLVNVFWTRCRLPVSDILAKDRSPFVVTSLGLHINSKHGDLCQSQLILCQIIKIRPLRKLRMA
jgi:hypothetical protein